MARKPTRGVRNNNPGNIDRNATKWQGMAEKQTDSRFITFVSPEYGIRAMAKTLLTYQNTHGLKTVKGIINRWAPPVENKTSAYVLAVSEAMGVGPTEVIDVDQVATMLPLVRAIIHHENGYDPYPDSTILEGLRRAGISDAPPKPLVKKTQVWTQAGAGVASACAAAASVAEPVKRVADGLGPYASAPVIQRLVIVLMTIAGILAFGGLISAFLKQQMEKRSAKPVVVGVVDNNQVGGAGIGGRGGGAVGAVGGSRGEGE